MKRIILAAIGILVIGAVGMAKTHSAEAQGGILIKGHSFTSVYYLGSDGKRYVFPNDKAYLSWYAGFTGIVTVADGDLTSFPLGGNVTYRPGKKLVKVVSDPKVYAVDKGGVLRWITTETVAAALYGTDWNTKVDDIPDIFFTNYLVGAPIVQASDFSPSAILTAIPDIDHDNAFKPHPTAGGPAPEHCTEDIWHCGTFGACSAEGIQVRSCILYSDCPGVETASPGMVWACTPPPPTCTADTWSCTAFSACTASGTQTRSCAMTMDCPNVTTPSPATTQSCTPPNDCTADTWTCSAFGACAANGTHTRTCTKTFECPNAVTPSPPLSESCIPPGQDALSATLSPTPASQSFVQGAVTEADFVGLTLKAGAKDVTVTQLDAVGLIDEAGTGGFSAGKDDDGAGIVFVNEDLTSCRLMDGTTQIGVAAAIASDTGLLRFTFLNYVIPAGATKSLTIHCTISRDARRLATDDALAFKITGIAAHDLNGAAVTPTGLPVNAAPTTTVRITDTGSLSFVLAPDDAESGEGTVLAGHADQVLGKILVTARNETVTLVDLRVSLLHPVSTRDFAKMRIFDGGKAVGFLTSVDANGNADFKSLNFVVSKDSTKTLVIKGNLKSLTDGARSTDDLTVFLDLTAPASNTFATVGSTSHVFRYTTSNGDLTGRRKILLNTRLTAAASGGSFSFTADAGGPASVKTVTMDITKPSALVLSLNSILNGQNVPIDSVMTLSSCGSGITACHLVVTFKSAQDIPAGTTKSFHPDFTLSGNTTDSTYSLSLLTDSVPASGELESGGRKIDDFQTGTTLTHAFIWSDIAPVHNDVDGGNPGSDDSGASNDWLNGWYLSSVL